MLDIDFSKLTIIAVVALLVLGPERLPRVARMAGALLRRARNNWQQVRSEIERELAAEDLKRTLQEARESAAAVDRHVRADVGHAASDIENSVRDAVAPTPSTPPDERT